MAWTRRSDAELTDRSEASIAPVSDRDSIIWDDADQDERQRPAERPFAASSAREFVMGLVILGFAGLLFAVAFGRGSDRTAELAEVAVTTSRLTPTPAPDSTTIPDDALIDQLPSTPPDLVDGHVLAWIDDRGMLRARRLVDGTDLEVSALAQTNLPPLPEHIHLLGAPNATWLLDVEEPQRSGKLSNTVRMVRLGDGLDSYGFSSEDESGTTEFFVGSLWGPAMNGLAEVDATSTVFSVPRAGIIASSRDATSEVLRGSGFEPLPSRLGRIVAASPRLVAGIHCDDLGRCVGRVAGWNGDDELQVDAAALSSPVIRISPDDRLLAAAGGSTLSIIDLETGVNRQWPLSLSIDDSMAWSLDSSTVFAVVEGAVVAMQVRSPELALSRVRTAGTLGARLDGADVAIFADGSGSG